jgi:hypothetical protein
MAGIVPTLPLWGLAREYLAKRTGLTDVTDRSRHWIGAFAAKSFMA